MECANCHTEISSDAQYCGNCGAKITNPDSSSASAPPVAVASTAPVENTSTTEHLSADKSAEVTTTPVQPSVDASSVAPVVVPGSSVPPDNAGTNMNSSGVANTTVAIPKQPSSGLSIAGMVLGILSILSCFIFFISIPLGALAGIFGIIGIVMKRGRGMAIAGLITGILGIILSILFIVFAVNPARQCAKDPYKDGCEKYNKSSSYSQSILNAIPDLPFSFK